MLRNLKISSPLKVLKKGLSTYKAENIMDVFDRNAKYLQRERSAIAPNAELYDYLKNEVGFRLADRVSDIKRTFKVAADIGKSHDIPPVPTFSLRPCIFIPKCFDSNTIL